SGYTCHYIRPEWTLPNRGDGVGAEAARAEHAKPTG
ncbi:MAG: peptide-methionine (S)-S-oxide reductase, partial [Mycobacterium sp.]|nr:peptide-methionine (S)-S-oxide reductase [Mycobacterium sp.]